jgi:hypothetical protein
MDGFGRLEYSSDEELTPATTNPIFDIEGSQREAMFINSERNQRIQQSQNAQESKVLERDPLGGVEDHKDDSIKSEEYAFNQVKMAPNLKFTCTFAVCDQSRQSSDP